MFIPSTFDGFILNFHISAPFINSLTTMAIPSFCPALPSSHELPSLPILLINFSSTLLIFLLILIFSSLLLMSLAWFR